MDDNKVLFCRGGGNLRTITGNLLVSVIAIFNPGKLVRFP